MKRKGFPMLGAEERLRNSCSLRPLVDCRSPLDFQPVKTHPWKPLEPVGRLNDTPGYSTQTSETTLKRLK